MVKAKIFCDPKDFATVVSVTFDGRFETVVKFDDYGGIGYSKPSTSAKLDLQSELYKSMCIYGRHEKTMHKLQEKPEAWTAEIFAEPLQPIFD